MQKTPKRVLRKNRAPEKSFSLFSFLKNLLSIKPKPREAFLKSFKFYAGFFKKMQSIFKISFSEKFTKERKIKPSRKGKIKTAVGLNDGGWD